MSSGKSASWQGKYVSMGASKRVRSTRGAGDESDVLDRWKVRTEKYFSLVGAGIEKRIDAEKKLKLSTLLRPVSESPLSFNLPPHGNLSEKELGDPGGRAIFAASPFEGALPVYYSTAAGLDPEKSKMVKALLESYGKIELELLARQILKGKVDF